MLCRLRANHCDVTRRAPSEPLEFDGPAVAGASTSACQAHHGRTSPESRPANSLVTYAMAPEMLLALGPLGGQWHVEMNLGSEEALCAQAFSVSWQLPRLR